jgi:hypothetical protein
MGRPSPDKSRIVIWCTPSTDLYDQFYTLKKRTHILLRRRLSNKEFLEYLLYLLSAKIAEEERRHVVTSY